ncbi:beta-lactamase family protein [bacterium SCSIO 12741]|nr:beta-lactamase family protein [bacterium SCSIO 12741]
MVKKIEREVEQQIRAGRFHGVVLVAQNGHVWYSKAAGKAHRRKKAKIDEYSVFQLASVSKMFTATAIMLLEQDGKLNYDDTVTQHLISFPYEGVTIRNLLNHRSGLPRYMVTSDQYWPRDTMMSNQQMHNLMVAHCPDPYYPPDHRFNYQNSNYAYLGLLVEKISGQSLPDFLRDRVFEPLEMNDTKVYSGAEDSDIPAAVWGHIRRGRRPMDPGENYINGVFGDKGVYSNVYDLLKFDQALYDTVLLKPTTIQEAFKPGSPEIKEGRDNYGFGWRISAFEKDDLVYHYGWWNGFKTCVMRFQNKRYTIIALTNTDHSLTLPKRIRDILYEN